MSDSRCLAEGQDRSRYTEAALRSADAGALVTNVDSNGNVISTHNTWAIFDNACRLDAILSGNGETLAYPVLENHPQTVDVAEDTLAFYIKANFSCY